MLLFALIFLWTPPHFWALSLFVRTDYADAGVPMLPVVAGAQGDAAADPALHLADGRGGGRALAARPAGRDLRRRRARCSASSSWCWRSRVLLNRATEPAGMKPEKRLFAFSILYLFALFGALVADRWLIA